MKIIKSIEEMQPYYVEEVNAYVFKEYDMLLDVCFEFDLAVACDIKAGDIDACDIDAGNINAWDIDAWDIDAVNINAHNIDAWDIDAVNINAHNIDAGDIKAVNIDAVDIDAVDIKAVNIDAVDIDAVDISYYAVCFAYGNITCKSIEGGRENAKHFCLDGEVKEVE